MNNTLHAMEEQKVVDRILLTSMLKWYILDITMVHSEGFLTISLRGGVSGVYLLLWKGEVVYAGQSLNVFARIGVHHQTMVRVRKGLRIQTNTMAQEAIVAFDEVRIKHCPKADLDRLEIELIQRYLPHHNTLMKRAEQPRHFDSLSAQPFFQEFMRKTEAKQANIPRRKLPSVVARVERGFQLDRDKRLRVSLPKLKCLENATS